MKPDLTGTRIVLRTIGPQDAADLFEIYGNPLTMEFASDPCFTSVSYTHLTLPTNI